MAGNIADLLRALLTQQQGPSPLLVDDTYNMPNHTGKPANGNLPFVLSPGLAPHDFHDPEGDPFTQLPLMPKPKPIT